MKSRITLLLILAPLFSCADFGPEVENPRLIPGISADGVRLGMSWEEVVHLLGEGYGIGSYDGAPQSGYSLGYRTGEHAGLSMMFPEWGGFSNAWGPVIHIQMDETYTGKSREGIGIGSTRDQLRGAFGNPEIFLDREGIPYSDSYVLHGRSVRFRYEAGKVRGISMQDRSD